MSILPPKVSTTNKGMILPKFTQKKKMNLLGLLQEQRVRVIDRNIGDSHTGRSEPSKDGGFINEAFSSSFPLLYALYPLLRPRTVRGGLHTTGWEEWLDTGQGYAEPCFYEGRCIINRQSFQSRPWEVLSMFAVKLTEYCGSHNTAFTWVNTMGVWVWLHTKLKIWQQHGASKSTWASCSLPLQLKTVDITLKMAVSCPVPAPHPTPHPTPVSHRDLRMVRWWLPFD